jgi:hypothetical protein
MGFIYVGSYLQQQGNPAPATDNRHVEESPLLAPGAVAGSFTGEVPQGLLPPTAYHWRAVLEPSRPIRAAEIIASSPGH